MNINKTEYSSNYLDFVWFLVIYAYRQNPTRKYLLAWLSSEPGLSACCTLWASKGPTTHVVHECIEEERKGEEGKGERERESKREEKQKKIVFPSY